MIKGEKTMKFLKKIMVPLAAGLAFMAGPANAAKVTMNIGVFCQRRTPIRNVHEPVC